MNLIFWVGSFPPERWRVKNFQRRGVGTAVIQFLAEFARSEAAKRIEGKVKPHDFDENPDLLNWYKRKGFNIAPSDGISLLLMRKYRWHFSWEVHFSRNV